MDGANVEFKELLQRSGWNQSEAARNLDLTTASVSRYVNDIDKPTKQTLRLFRIILAGENHEPSESNKGSSRLAGEEEVWRRRANVAEKKLNDLQNGIRKLLEVSSKPLSEAQQIAKRAGDRYDKTHSSP